MVNIKKRFNKLENFGRHLLSKLPVLWNRSSLVLHNDCVLDTFTTGLKQVDFPLNWPTGLIQSLSCNFCGS